MKVAVTKKSSADPWELVDGRNRLDAAELVGLPVQIIKSRSDVTVRVGHKSQFASFTDDPYEYVLSANIHRRHLTAEQKRELIAKVLKAQPEKSNRTIAKQTKVDHKTVGTVRNKLEGRGEIPHVSTVEDTKGRKQPTQEEAARRRRLRRGEENATACRALTIEVEYQEIKQDDVEADKKALREGAGDRDSRSCRVKIQGDAAHRRAGAEGRAASPGFIAAKRASSNR